MADTAQNREVIARQLCTGCANSRDVRMTLAEAQQQQRDLPISEREKHKDCYPLNGATRSEWVVVNARWPFVVDAPVVTPSRTDRQPHPSGLGSSAPSAATGAGRAVDAPGPYPSSALPSDGA